MATSDAESYTKTNPRIDMSSILVHISYDHEDNNTTIEKAPIRWWRKETREKGENYDQKKGEGCTSIPSLDQS